ncbi:hypothetical protein Tco_0200004 [Tanacetum coccineum]
MQTTHAAPMPHDSPIPRVHSLKSDKGSLTLNELTVLFTQLSTKVASLEEDLKQTRKVYGNAYTKLILKVKKLEKTVKTSQARRRAKIVVSENEEDEEIRGGLMIHIKQILVLAVDLVSTAGMAVVSTASGWLVLLLEWHNSVEINIPSPIATKDKGKVVMQESEPLNKIKKRVQIQMKQERLDYEAAVRIQEELDESERQRMAQVHQAA